MHERSSTFAEFKDIILFQAILHIQIYVKKSFDFFDISVFSVFRKCSMLSFNSTFGSGSGDGELNSKKPEVVFDGGFHICDSPCLVKNGSIISTNILASILYPMDAITIREFLHFFQVHQTPGNVGYDQGCIISGYDFKCNLHPLR